MNEAWNEVRLRKRERREKERRKRIDQVNEIELVAVE